MRIAFITTMDVSAWGGSEQLWTMTAELALKEGHAVFCSIYEWPELPEKQASLLSNGAIFFKKTRRLPETLIQRVAHKISRSIQKTTAEVRAIRLFKPDVICFSQGDSFSAAESKPYRDLIAALKIPYLLIAQMNYETTRYSRWNDEALHSFINKAKKFCFVSARNMEMAKKQLVSDFDNGYVINNPVNLSSYEEVLYPSTENYQIAVVARLDCFFKGQDTLLYLLSRSKWQQRTWHLNLYGSGPDLEYLTAIIHKLKLEKRVSFHGQVADVRAIWEKNQLLVMPSYAEGTPLALVEAMICGRPAVGTDVGGNAEVIEDNISGYISSAPVITHLDEAMERAWNDRTQWEVRGKAAHESILKKINRHPERELLELILA